MTFLQKNLFLLAFLSLFLVGCEGILKSDVELDAEGEVELEEGMEEGEDEDELGDEDEAEDTDEAGDLDADDSEDGDEMDDDSSVEVDGSTDVDVEVDLDVSVKPQTVVISAKEFAFVPSSVTVNAGSPITFTLKNAGTMNHDLVIEGTSGRTTMLSSGSSGSFTVNLSPGTYTYYCSVSGHRAAGMVGTLVVK